MSAKKSKQEAVYRSHSKGLTRVTARSPEKYLAYTESQLNGIKKIDYSPSGKSPLQATMNSLKTEMRVSEKKKRGNNILSISGPAIDRSLGIEQLEKVLQQCKIYEVNVRRHKVDLNHIRTMTTMLADLQKMADLRESALKS